MPRHKVLLVVQHFDSSGTSRLVEDLLRAREIASRFDILLAVWLAKPGERHRDFSALSGSLIEIGARHGHDLRAGRRLSQIIRREQPSLVHLVSVPVAARLCLKGRPFTASIHVYPQNWKARTAMRVGLFRARRVIAVSEHLARNIRALTRSPVETITNGTAAPTAVRTGLRSGSSELRVIFVARLVPSKGVDTLLRLVAHYQRRPRTERVHFHIFGSGPMEGRVRSAASDHPDILSFHGPESDLDTLYGTGDALLFLSEEETFGRPVAEALARGIPVVCSKLPEAMEELFGDAPLIRIPARELESITVVLSSLARTRRWDAGELHNYYVTRLTLSEQMASWTSAWERACVSN